MDPVERKYAQSQLWRRSVICHIKLAPNQVIHGHPQPVTVEVRRQTYFPLILEQYRYHFSSYVAPEIRKLDLCVEYRGEVLPMHYPVQVLMELLEIDSLSSWEVILRFKKYQKDQQVLHSSRIQSFRRYFQAQVKKADELKFTGKLYRTFSEQDQMNLWMGFFTDDFNKFWKGCSNLLNCPEGKSFTFIPFRIYQKNRPCVEKRFRTHSKSGEPRYLRNLLVKCMHEPEKIDDVSVLIQGEDVLTFDIPLHALAANFCYPDNYVHICIIPDEMS